MIYLEPNFSYILFKGLNIQSYVAEEGIASMIDFDLEGYGPVEAKQHRPPNHNVNQDYDVPFSPEIDDLSRLHFLVKTRKVTTILEFGIGYSTVIFNDALLKNETIHQSFVSKNLRRNNAFECHSVDSYSHWIEQVNNKYKLDKVKSHFCKLKMGQFNGRACTFYDPLPNVCPDLIYLDGPDQFSPVGDVNGVTTCHKDRMPMVGDILVIEHFLTPGTLIITDGRSANARFLKANLQRDWLYCHDELLDHSYFELLENPLGIYNRRQIDYCLGPDYYSRLSKHSC